MFYAIRKVHWKLYDKTTSIDSRLNGRNNRLLSLAAFLSMNATLTDAEFETLSNPITISFIPMGYTRNNISDILCHHKETLRISNMVLNQLLITTFNSVYFYHFKITSQVITESP